MIWELVGVSENWEEFMNLQLVYWFYGMVFANNSKTTEHTVMTRCVKWWTPHEATTIGYEDICQKPYRMNSEPTVWDYCWSKLILPIQTLLLMYSVDMLGLNHTSFRDIKSCEKISTGPLL